MSSIAVAPVSRTGRICWREMARVDGKPKKVSVGYLGTAGVIAAAMTAWDTAMAPERTRHLGFGDTAAVWLRSGGCCGAWMWPVWSMR
jgi:hypothetical protein